MDFRAVLLVLALATSLGSADLFTSLIDMAKLVDVEDILMTKIDDYIKYQETKLVLMKKKLADYAKEHAIAAEDPMEYVTNPVRSFLLVKRLTKDWTTIENDVLNDPSMLAIKNVATNHPEFKFPSQIDLNGAAIGLMRLQDTYKMAVEDIAKGRLNGVQYAGSMTANDCFEMGLQTYSKGHYYHAVVWLRESLARYEIEVEKTITKIDILDYLSYSLYMLGDNENALKHINDLIEINPTHRAAYNKQLFTEEDGVTAKPSVEIELVSTVEETYGKLCRGEGVLPVEVASRLACRYVDYGIPFLKLAPLKEEEAFLDPRIVVFHDVISDAEIATVKRIAQPRFYRAGVKNHFTGEAQVSDVRISKVAWLRDYDHPDVDRIARRTSDMGRGLSRETVEELQVVNYGIGGHYLPHFDFSDKRDPGSKNDDPRLGNRIATVLFYMTDVDQGGATVFPKIGVSVFPKKGTATLWWNLHLDNEGDYRTQHAACPVLSGTKWICNKWYHERSQEFIRPCGMEPDSIPIDLLE